ncbi:MAG: hypothetical protein ACWA45_10585 [Flavobacteriales bacterium]
MKKIIYILTILFASITFAQEEEELSPFCSTSPVSTHQLDLDAIRGLDHSNDIFHLKIYVHVLKKSEAPHLGQSVEDVNRQLKYLYDTFDPLDIFFVWDGNIDYIDNKAFFDDPDYYTDPDVFPNGTEPIFNTNNHTDGIDIYFFDVEKGIASPSGSMFGRADDIGGSAFIIGGSFKGRHYGGEMIPSTWTNLILHEMGHVLYLWHTHHGTAFFEQDDTTCPELVVGSNSTTCGDYITDTPADPGIRWFSPPIEVDENCTYTNNPNDNIPDQDANDDYYQPDPTNPMAISYPTCYDTFTLGQKKRMKNAIWYLPVLRNAFANKWNYIRTNTLDCYVCDLPKTFTFYTYNNESFFNVLDNTDNVSVSITPIDNTSATVTVTNLDPDADEGSSGSFKIGLNDENSASQPIWVGLPQAVPDETVNGPTEVNAGSYGYYKIDDGSLRLKGIDTYKWDFPEPNESWVFFGGPPPSDPTIWQYSYLSKYLPKNLSGYGDQTGIVTVRGNNPCGLGDNGDLNELCVTNLDDPEGDTCTPPIPQPIYYYPNPAGSLLEVDLSLQPYKIFDVVIYDENQTVRYSDQSENVIKTVDTFNLTNGTYYLHIYDGSDLILSAILIINH